MKGTKSISNKLVQKNLEKELLLCFFEYNKLFDLLVREYGIAGLYFDVNLFSKALTDIQKVLEDVSLYTE